MHFHHKALVVRSGNAAAMPRIGIYLAVAR